MDEMVSYQKNIHKQVSIAMAVTTVKTLKKIAHNWKKDYESIGVYKVLKTVNDAIGSGPVICTGQKTSYPNLINQVFGVHATHYDTQNLQMLFPKDKNPLFGINHAHAMLRHDIGRLTQNSIGYSKKRRELNNHLAIYIAFNNGY